MSLSPVELEALVRERAPQIAQAIRQAAEAAQNEADLVAAVEDILKEFEGVFEIGLRPQHERTLINGRADAVYNRFVIEYEPPRSLRVAPTHGHNRHAVQQVKQYMDELERLDRQKKERLAGVVLDGFYYIFVRYRDEHWRVDDPLAVTPESTETFLRYLLSLSTELALTPENLARDFGENSNVARLVVSALYHELGCMNCPKAQMLFQQWQIQFSEITGWAKQSSDSKLIKIVRSFGVTERDPDLMRFFFAVHTYYATFIKLLAVQIAQYYMMPRFGSGLQQVASADSLGLQSYLARMERGGIFKELGINNFLEGDFFGWYLDIWDERLDHAIRRIVSELANYSLVTLDVDPEQTRDLLKKLYQDLVPRQLRHALGEYYTPDWLAERLLNQLGYVGDPTKRLLDPACGSGTFLVLAIRRVREYVKDKTLSERAALEQVLSNIVGFDLNPLAVISARTNYLLALGDLLKHRMTEISIPVYLADSVLTPSFTTESSGQISFLPSEESRPFRPTSYTFPTVVGYFSIPEALVKAHYINQLADLLEESVNNDLSRDMFRQRLLTTFPLDVNRDSGAIDVASDLYEQLHRLHINGINGIWARIIKNAFAPLFVEKFDYVAGNPPWINWLNLPENYRQATSFLWERYKLFPHRGLEARLGDAMDDISVLMTYVTLDRYLVSNGILGFVITQSVFKTSGGGKGFRRFQLGDSEHIEVLQVDDMSAIKPFDDASNQTSVTIMRKGKRTHYPVPYNYWRKSVLGKAIDPSGSLDETLGQISQAHWVAEPVNPGDITSQWLTGRPKALTAVRKALGNSSYVARHGVHTWRSAIYWIEVLGKRPDGLVVIANLVERAKIKVSGIQSAVEAAYIYPLLQRGDIKAWHAVPSTYILLAQDLENPSRGLPEETLKVVAPKTYNYFRSFEKELRSRSGYQKYLEPSGNPFYSVYNVGPYTFAPYKVVWPNIGSEIEAAVVSTFDEKLVLPEHVVTMVPFDSAEEAYYVCACINSSPANFAVQSYSTRGGKSFGTPHVLENVGIPVFDPTNETHKMLAELSEKAHVAEAAGQAVGEIEAEIDRLAAQLWDLTDEELAEIQQSLAELGGISDEPVADDE